MRSGFSVSSLSSEGSGDQSDFSHLTFPTSSDDIDIDDIEVASILLASTTFALLVIIFTHQIQINFLL